MDNTTMTIDAQRSSRVRSVCPVAGRVLPVGTRGWVRGTSVPASHLITVTTAVPAPTYVGAFGAPIQDLAFRSPGDRPV